MSNPDWEELRRLRLANWAPRSQLRVPSTEVKRPASPVIDVHNHLGRWLSDGEWMVDDVAAFIDTMDECRVRTVVNLDGLWGDELTANVERYDDAFPGRFATFCQLDWSRLSEDDGVEKLRASLLESVSRGARGVKVWKNLGLTARDATGRLVSPDDERVIELMSYAGELGLPVLIHTADPIAFFAPADRHNERLDELLEEPDWWFGDRKRYPTFDSLLDAHAALVLACPNTQFIGAHVGCVAEDLDRVERLLSAAPNYSIDTAGRMGELGRQPRRFAKLVAAHPNQVLFGTDVYPPSAEQYRLHFRFFETADEGFAYDPDSEVPGQGRWLVSALALDAQALARVYRLNAKRVLGL